MTKRINALVVGLMVLLLVSPALAFEMKWGGAQRVRYIAQQNFDGDNDVDDMHYFFDQRTRLFMNFIANENLRAVVALEIGDITWGNSGGVGKGHGGATGADAVNVETKRAYLDFNPMPSLPINVKAGIQGWLYHRGWIVDDDAAAFKINAAFDPITVELAYSKSDDNDTYTNAQDDVDQFVAMVNFDGGPFYATVTAFAENGHDRIDPVGIGYFPIAIEDNTLYDIGIELGYTIEGFMSAMVSFVKNFGSIETTDVAGDDEYDYTGFMFDGNIDFFFDPFTFNIGGFYTSGQDWDEDDEVTAFVYPNGASHYYSEIVGLGVFDRIGPGGTGAFSGAGGWDGDDVPSNLWAINAGAAHQLAENTKISFSYWYFGTPEEVLADTSGETSNEVGHELDLQLDHTILEDLDITVVGAYLFTGDGYSDTQEDDDDAWELGAQLQYSF